MPQNLKIEQEEHNLMGMYPKVNKGCSQGVHPRDKVFTWHKINNPYFQREIDKGNVVAGCSKCRKTYIVKTTVEGLK